MAPCKSIYVIAAGDLVKVGISEDVSSRLSAIQHANPLASLCWSTDIICNAADVETYVHGQLRQYRVHGEWFYIDPVKAKKVVRDAFYGFGKPLYS